MELFRETVSSLQGDLVHEHFGMAAFPSVWSRSWLAWSLAELGEFAEGIAASEEGAQIAESGDHAYSRVQAAFGLGTLYVIQGRCDRAIPTLEQGLVIARVSSLPFLVPFVTGPLGAAYALEGQLERAVTLLEQAVEQAVSMQLLANHALRLAWLGRAQLLAGRRDVALDLAHRAFKLAEDRQERGQRAHAQRLLGDIVANADDSSVSSAEAAYREALSLAEALAMRPLIAHCHLGLGKLYRRTGKRQQAQEHLTTATTLYREMDMRFWLEQADAEMKELAS